MKLKDPASWPQPDEALTILKTNRGQDAKGGDPGLAECLDAREVQESSAPDASISFHSGADSGL